MSPVLLQPHLTRNYTLSEAKAFFDDFKVTYNKLKLAPSDIYDADEISIGVVKTMSKAIRCINGKNYYDDKNAPQLIVINSASTEGRYAIFRRQIERCR